MRPPLLVRTETERRRCRARAVRGDGLSGPRRSGLGLSRRRPRRLRPLGGAQGPAGHRRPGRDGRGDLGAALPRRDRALQHRAHLQLRGAPRPADRLHGRLHRHGVRRRQVAQGDRQRAARAFGQAGPAAGGAGLCVRDRGPGGARPSAQPGAAVLRLQGRQRDTAAGPAEAHRHGCGAQDGRRRVGHLRHGRLPGARGRRGRAVGRLRPVHRGAHPRRADLRLPGLHERVRRQPPRPGQHRGVPAVRVVLPAARTGHGSGPGPQVRIGSGDGRAAHRGAAGGRRRPDGTAETFAVDAVRARGSGHRHRTLHRADRGRVPARRTPTARRPPGSKGGPEQRGRRDRDRYRRRPRARPGRPPRTAPAGADAGRAAGTGRAVGRPARQRSRPASTSPGSKQAPPRWRCPCRASTRTTRTPVSWPV